MPKARLGFDRYHGTMGNFSLKEESDIQGKLLADVNARFYITQRKLPFAPCVGHERLLESLVARHFDAPRLRFLREDKAGLSLLADRLTKTGFPFKIRTVRPGTIMFAQEPLADIEGPFVETQLQEVSFEHAFDDPMTIAGNAFAIRLEAGDRWLSDFSLRRDGTLDRSCDVARYSYIAGFNDTSNMEAAFLLDLNAVGTMAHYLVQAFASYMYHPELDVSGKEKHFQQVAFERWLDAHPNGTTLLLDTISVKLGTIHAIRAANSSEARKKALKAVRIDSGNLVRYARWVRAMLDANGLTEVKIILTSDLDAKKIREIVHECGFVFGFGVGTKLAAEVENVAGVIFKLCAIGGLPTLKCSETKGKETFPGSLQVWRCIDRDNFYVKDVITRFGEPAPTGKNIRSTIPLLESFWNGGQKMIVPSDEEQRTFVLAQREQFRSIKNYPVEVSAELASVRDEIVGLMKDDEIGEEGIIMVPLGGD